MWIHNYFSNTCNYVNLREKAVNVLLQGGPSQCIGYSMKFVLLAMQSQCTDKGKMYSIHFTYWHICYIRAIILVSYSQN